MRFLQQELAIFLSCTLVFGLVGCNKKSLPGDSGGVQNQAGQQLPATTYAAPTADQLYQLVAPIALFPDNLVAQVLAASTYPDQVGAAWSWLQQNSALKGQQLMEAANAESWDASVKGLTQFSDVLQQMATNLSWTSALGDAYYNIPQSVMNAVQVMRQRAYQAGNLQTNSQQSVTVQNQAPGAAAPPVEVVAQPAVTVVQPPPQTIIIQPAQPAVVYVPVYNPTVVYGAPVAVYPGYSTGAMVATSLISFGVGVAVGAAISGGGCCGWGWNSWGCGWHNSTVVYNHNTYISTSNTFVNRNHYYSNGRYNYNNFNRNVNANINRNINTNINRNNFNRNSLNSNNRTNNFRGSYSTPHFNQRYDAPQFRGQSQGNVARSREAPNFNRRENAAMPERRPERGYGQQPNFSRRENMSTPERRPERGYGEQSSRAGGNTAFANYGQGGNARINSARGQQSLEGGRFSSRGGGGGLEESGRAHGGRRR
ncbi:MAG: DUF3300 domain-containing protein [Acidobacteria bacterium]|nr:DUF3300 domain-containing protein [Acidobacteriota bacterium]